MIWKVIRTLGRYTSDYVCKYLPISNLSHEAYIYDFQDFAIDHGQGTYRDITVQVVLIHSIFLL